MSQETFTGKDYLDDYLVHIELLLLRSRHTIRNYRNDISKFLRYLDRRSILCKDAGRPTVRAYLRAMKESGVSPASIRRIAVTIRGFYTWLDSSGRTLTPSKGQSILSLRTPKNPKRLPHLLEQPDIDVLMTRLPGNEPTNIRDRAIIELLYATGVRVSELVGLDTRDIDFNQMQIRVIGKGSKERICLFGIPAKEALQNYLENGRTTLVSGAETAFFLNRFGKRLSQRSVQRLVKSAGIKVGLSSSIHPHLLRHSFATHLVESGADIRLVQHLLGHSSPDTTQIYTTLSKRSNGEEISSALSRARNTG